MKKYHKIIAFVAVIGLFGCSNSDSPAAGGGGGGPLVPQATYSITFMPDFTATSHPIDYPANAGFSKMVLVAHGSGQDVYSLGQVASPGLKEYAEEGGFSILTEELSSTEGNPTSIKTGNNMGPTGSQSFTIVVTPSTSLISFVAKISPSPDWFVGIDAFNLANPDNTLVEEAELRLFPIDAGTDAGTTYESADEPEAGPVSEITGLPFTDTSVVPILGLLKIERIN